MCTENLSSAVVVMKSAQDGARPDLTGSLNRTRNRRILLQQSMRSDAIVIVGVGFQDPTQMHLAQDNDVVHTFTPDRSDQPFRAIKLQLPVFRPLHHHAENETIAAISEPAIAETANRALKI